MSNKYSIPVIIASGCRLRMPQKKAGAVTLLIITHPRVGSRSKKLYFLLGLEIPFKMIYNMPI